MWPSGLNSLRSQVVSPTSLIEISSAHTDNFPGTKKECHTDFNDVPTIASSDAGVTSSVVHPFTLSIGMYQQATAATHSNQHNPMSCMKGFAGNLYVVLMIMSERSCGKLHQSGGSDVETSFLNGKRDREFGSVSSQEQAKILD